MNRRSSEQPRLILASQSPRRAELLRDAGFVFEQVNPPFADPDQPRDDTLDAEQHAMDLALAKARSLAATLHEPALILAADTLCIDPNNRLIGKPSDRENARLMLNGFVNGEHAVVSGVALLETSTAEQNQPITFADRAVVRFGSISDGEIDAYLALNQWQGKAGGYNLFDRLAAGWPIRVTGDPTTVVGLPMKRLIKTIAKID